MGNESGGCEAKELGLGEGLGGFGVGLEHFGADVHGDEEVAEAGDGPGEWVGEVDEREGGVGVDDGGNPDDAEGAGADEGGDGGDDGAV